MNNSPFALNPHSSEGIWFDRLIALLPMLAFSVIAFGIRPLAVALAAAISALLVEFACLFVRNSRNFSLMPIALALTVIMLCPVSLPLYLAAAIGAMVSAAANFAALINKGGSLINIPAVAWMLLLLLVPKFICTYPASEVVRDLPLFADPTGFDTAESILIQLEQGMLPNLSDKQLLFGELPGAFGTAVIGCAVSFVYLCVRHCAAWEASLSMLISSLLLGFFTNEMSVPLHQLLLLELSGGGLMFAAVIVVSDFSAPKTRFMRIICGLSAGVGTVLMQNFGFDEFSAAFAITAAVVLTNLCERPLCFIINKLHK